jgi:hypothetical protein
VTAGVKSAVVIAGWGLPTVGRAIRTGSVRRCPGGRGREHGQRGVTWDTARRAVAGAIGRRAQSGGVHGPAAWTEPAERGESVRRDSAGSVGARRGQESSRYRGSQ